MKLLLSILAALLLSTPSMAQGASTASFEDGMRSSSTACKGKKGKKRRRGGAKKPPPKPEPEAAPAPDPAPSASEGEGILDSGEGDLTGMSESDAASASAPPAGTGLRRSNRMEFDARLVKGQTATSGAVYLFQRAPRKLPPLLSMRQSYLKQIVEPVLGKAAKKEK